MQNWAKHYQKLCPSHLCLPTLILATRPFVQIALRRQRQHEVQNLGRGETVGPQSQARVSDGQCSFQQKRRKC